MLSKTTPTHTPLNKIQEQLIISLSSDNCIVMQTQTAKENGTTDRTAN